MYIADMTKKLLPIFAVLLIAGCISPAEKEFNDSGQAKAIEDETDLWKFYKDIDAGFSFKYPHDVSIEKATGSMPLSVTIQDVEGLADTMGFNEETARANMEALANGEYGEHVDFALEASRKVINLGKVNAQEFMVLGRFEVCSITFIRNLYFFNNDKQIVIRLGLPTRETGINSMPEYFQTNEENCGDDPVWKFDEMPRFYDNLANGSGTGAVQHWFDTFDKIVNTISIEINSPFEVLNILEGKWTSMDDDKSKIEFTMVHKIDSYDGKEVSKEQYAMSSDGKYLIVGTGEEAVKYEIMSFSENQIELLHLPRGNILKYTKDTE